MKTIARAAIMLALVSNVALANDLADTISDAKANGVTFDLKGNNLIINVEESVANAALSRVILDTGITENIYPIDELPKSPTADAEITGIIYAQEMIPYFYNGTQIDNLNATLNILTINKYGNLDSNECATFVFTRALYNKINWDHKNYHLLLDLQDDDKFTFSDACIDTISDELINATVNESSSNDDSDSTTTTYTDSEIQTVIQQANSLAGVSQ